MSTVDTPSTPTTTEGAHRPVYQEEIVHRPGVRRLLAVARIVIGFTFLWAFLDKLLGLGFATPSERAWIHGGSPTRGFLGHVTGPFSGMFSSLAGQTWVDWLFMLGLPGIGLAAVLGAGLKIAAWSGTLMLLLMYLAQFPLGQPADMSVNNPIVDSHWHEALLLLISAYTLAGDTWGLGRWWGRRVGNGPLR